MEKIIPITIVEVANGFQVTVGCQSFVFECREEEDGRGRFADILSEYIIAPGVVYDSWAKRIGLVPTTPDVDNAKYPEAGMAGGPKGIGRLPRDLNELAAIHSSGGRSYPDGLPEPSIPRVE